MPSGTPALEVDVWRGGLRWVVGTLMQAERFELAFFDFQRALVDAEIRADCATPEGATRRASYDRHPPYDPERPIRVPTWAGATQVANELDFLVMAVRNVLRAQARLPTDTQPTMTGQDVRALLRNVVERWDEIGVRSAGTLASGHPGVVPGVVEFANQEIRIGGVPLSRIRACLARVHEALTAALASAGITVPNDTDSVVAGDDALQWPEDRIRISLWSVPTLDTQD